MIRQELEDYIKKYPIPKDVSSEEKEKNKKAWATLWRRNPNLYAHLKLGLNLYPFQHNMLYSNALSSTSVDICTRGLTKTFLVSVIASVECLLKPNTTVIVAASTISQGKILVKEKIEDELCKKLSPYMKYLYDIGLIKFSYTQEGVTVDFIINNSKILVLPPLDSSRGKRGQFIIYEECRLLKKLDIDSIFEGMLIPRQATFMSNPKWNGNEKLLEDTKSVYITSAGWKTEWFWGMFKKTFQDYFNDEDNRNSIFAGDIYLAMRYGLKTKRQFKNYRKKMSEMRFDIEIMNIMVGESEDAYYNLEMFKRNSVLTRPFYPPTVEDIINKIDKQNRKKEIGEVRIIATDTATKDSNSNSVNDKSSIVCMSGRLNKKGDMLIRNIDHIETFGGSQTREFALRIRELFYDYQADYITPDFLGGGEQIYRDVLSAPYYHEARGEWFSGFTICNEKDLQVRPDGDLNDFKDHVIDPNAIPCIIPFKGGASTNSEYHIAMKNSLRDNKIKFLIDELEAEELLSKDKDYIMADSEGRALRKIAYIQTGVLINESINLSVTYTDGKVKLTESRTGTKDIYVSTIYGNYIMSLIENKKARNNNQEEFNEDDWLCIAY